MNREQLLALHAAGIITQAALAASLRAVSAGTIVTELSIVRDQHLAARELAVDTTARTITVQASIYGVLIPSHRMILEPGALTPRPDKQNKLLIDHDHAQPVGYMQSGDASTLETTYYLPEREAGDVALADAQDGLRDGASVGFTVLDYSFDEQGILHVLDADWYETSLCAVPAVAGAGVIDVAAAVAATPTPTQENNTVNREQLAAALTAGTITQDQHDGALSALDALDTNLSAANGGERLPEPERAALAAGPQVVEGLSQGIQVRERGLSLQEVTSRVAAAAATGNPASVALALSDVIPADDAGTAFINRQDWIGELFTARSVSRPWVDSFGVPQQLTSLRYKGYRVTERPTVAEYAGNKTDVPSLGTFKTEPVEFTAKRWAGGWDIDRAFVDLGDSTFLTMFWNAAVEEYQEVSDADIAKQAIAAAHANTGTAPDVLTAILQIAAKIRRVKGASLNRIKLSDDLFDQYALLKADEVPFWLRNAGVGTINLLDGSFDVATLNIQADPQLAAGTVQGFDSRGAIVREKSPIQVQAVDVAKGGIDLGFYSYGSFELHDPRVFAERKVVAPAAE